MKSTVCIKRKKGESMEDAEFEKEGGKFKGGEEGEEEQFLSHIKHLLTELFGFFKRGF